MAGGVDAVAVGQGPLEHHVEQGVGAEAVASLCQVGHGRQQHHAGRLRQAAIADHQGRRCGQVAAGRTAADDDARRAVALDQGAVDGHGVLRRGRERVVGRHAVVDRDGGDADPVGHQAGVGLGVVAAAEHEGAAVQIEVDRAAGGRVGRGPDVADHPADGLGLHRRAAGRQHVGRQGRPHRLAVGHRAAPAVEVVGGGPFQDRAQGAGFEGRAGLRADGGGRGDVARGQAHRGEVGGLLGHGRI